jgi:hypothetical protein
MIRNPHPNRLVGVGVVVETAGRGHGETMRELHYADGVLIVDDEVCLAVFQYAVALAQAGSADMVTIPILWGSVRDKANLVLGPSSQLYCTPTEAEFVDLRDPELVQEITSRTVRIGPTTAVPVAASDPDAFGSILDEV